jgi:hypothetical protein
VFLAYANGNGHALIDRELYLPKGKRDAVPVLRELMAIG